MRILFFGTPEFAVATLDKILKSGHHEVVGVVTAPDKPAGRGHAFHQSDVKKYALEMGLKLFQPEKLKDPEFQDNIRALNADIFVVVAFRMLPESVWAMPPKGTFNVHAALLPRYRGAAPINWAIINGETETGVTTFMLRHDIDSGPILSQRKLEIGPNENVGSLYERLMAEGAVLAIETLDEIEAGTATQIPQADMGIKVCLAPKLNPDNCTIDWSKSSKEIHNLVRGLSPYPGARTEMILPTGERIAAKIFSTAVGQVSPKGWIVECHDGPLEILELQPAGKKKMKAEEYLRGLRCDRYPEFK